MISYCVRGDVMCVTVAVLTTEVSSGSSSGSYSRAAVHLRSAATPRTPSRQRSRNTTSAKKERTRPLWTNYRLSCAVWWGHTYRS